MLPDHPAWMADANCRGADVDMFFPARDEDVSSAKAVCRECDVQVECLTHAMTNGETKGVWGGLSERERRRIRRARRLKVVW
jgi:WhiB family redox-sensing transcriptional regulator